MNDIKLLNENNPTFLEDLSADKIKSLGQFKSYINESNEKLSSLHYNKIDPKDAKPIYDKLWYLLKITRSKWIEIVSKKLIDISEFGSNKEYIDTWVVLGLLFNKIIEAIDRLNLILDVNVRDHRFDDYVTEKLIPKSFDLDFNFKNLKGRTAFMLMEGNIPFSHMVKRFTIPETMFSHSAILYQDNNGGLWVVHTAVVNGTVKVPIKEFFKKYPGIRYYIFTIDNEDDTKKIEAVVDDFIKDSIGVPFSLAGLSRNNRRACVNLLNDLYEKALGRKLVQVPYVFKGGKGNFQRLKDLNTLIDGEDETKPFERIMPAGILPSPELKLSLVLENHGITLDSLYGSVVSDFIISKLENNGANESFALRKNYLLRFVGYIFAPLAHTIVPNFIPKEAGGSTLAYFFEYDLVHNYLKRKLVSNNKEYLKTNGYYMSHLNMDEYITSINMNTFMMRLFFKRL